MMVRSHVAAIICGFALVGVPAADAQVELTTPTALQTLTILGYVPETLVVAEITTSEFTAMASLMDVAEGLRFEFLSDQRALDARLQTVSFIRSRILAEGESDALLAQRQLAANAVADARDEVAATMLALRGVALVDIDAPRAERLNHAASVLHYGVPAECLVLDQAHEDWEALVKAGRRQAANAARSQRADAAVLEQRPLSSDEQAALSAADNNATVDAARTDIELGLDAMRLAWAALESE